MNTSLVSAFCAMAIVSARAQSVNDLVDPFWGCGGTTSAPSEGMARGWNWEKAQTGNTFPGAIRPFGLVSVCGFTGGYSSGYGRFGVSSGGKAPERLKTMRGFGFTHFHNNGAGWIGSFLNLFLFTPYAEGVDLGQAGDAESDSGLALI